MSIKIRLVLSYLAMLVIPFILIFLAAIAILIGQFGGFGHANLIKPNYLKDLTEKAPLIYIELENTITKNPDKLKDITYLDGLDKQLSIMNTWLALKKDDKLIYTSGYLNEPEIYKQLKLNNRYEKRPIIVGKEPYTVMNRDIKFSDKTSGTLYIITGVGPLSRFARSYFTSLGYAILIIVILTNGVITYLVSRSILKPLKILKHGTEEIQKGNLNFSVKCTSQDEIGEVCTTFEEMRVKLKGSIGQQLQIEENRKELVSNISHDLKTPITSIKGYVEGIMDGVADTPEKMDKYIRTIYTKAVDMDRLIDDLFLFSKLDLKSLPFNFEKIDMVKYLKDCYEELYLDLEKKGITFELETDLAGVDVIADREKLKRVIMNVIDNSVKYMGRADGNILIRLTDEQEKVKVEIKDNGQGINNEELSYVFDRFYRADRSRNTMTGGSGLGLAIARQIINGHSGDIWAASEPLNGTSIFFTLKKICEVEAEASDKI
jgi:signal transduction histidine kinase